MFCRDFQPIQKYGRWFVFVILKRNFKLYWNEIDLLKIKLLWSILIKIKHQYCQPINHPNYRWNMLKMQMFYRFCFFTRRDLTPNMFFTLETVNDVKCILFQLKKRRNLMRQKWVEMKTEKYIGSERFCPLALQSR